MNIDEASIKDGELVVRGWAISPVGISRVKVYVNDKFAAGCFYGHPRPDVRRVHPFVQDSERSGFSLVKRLNRPDQRDPMSLKIIVIDSDSSESEYNKSLDDEFTVELLDTVEPAGTPISV